MLYTQTVKAGTLDLIKELTKDKELGSFNLVGGTALSLKLGHRISVDIDLFTDRDFDSQQLSLYIAQKYNPENIKTIKNGLFCFIDGIKVDLIAHQYPLLNKIEEVDGIRMLSLQDIGAMKLNVILHNGTRLKDFVDMYFLLEKIPLINITSGFEQKYPDVNTQIAHTALLYHKDINISEKIDFQGPDISFGKIATRLQEAVQTPSRVFANQLRQGLHPPNKISIKKGNRKKPGF